VLRHGVCWLSRIRNRRTARALSTPAGPPVLTIIRSMVASVDQGPDQGVARAPFGTPGATIPSMPSNALRGNAKSPTRSDVRRAYGQRSVIQTLKIDARRREIEPEGGFGRSSACCESRSVSTAFPSPLLTEHGEVGTGDIESNHVARCNVIRRFWA
jgi:hypothetical protein